MRRGARYALALLLAVNLLNYVDRQALYAVFPLIKADLNLSDTGLGFLGSAFMLCYMLAAPVFGRLGDRTNRARLAAGGLAVWSLATMLSGMSASYRMLLAARTLVGWERPVLALFRPVCLPTIFPANVAVGCCRSSFGHPGRERTGIHPGWTAWSGVRLAAGFSAGRSAGAFLALPLYFLNDPSQSDRQAASLTHERILPELRRFWLNRTYVHATLSMAAMTFALGGLAQWAPSFLQRSFGLEVARGNTIFGMITVISGIIGTLAGGWLGDRFQRRSAAGYLYVSAVGFLLGAPLMILA